jgi:hypothetical protein
VKLQLCKSVSCVDLCAIVEGNFVGDCAGIALVLLCKVEGGRRKVYTASLQDVEVLQEAPQETAMTTLGGRYKEDAGKISL